MVSRHVTFDPEKLQIKMDRGHLVSMLEIDIEVPSTNEGRTAAVA